MENATCDKSGQQRAVRNREQRERINGVRKKTDAGIAVRMGWNQAHLDARGLPKKTRPDEQPEIPAAQQKLEEGETDIAIPHPRERQPRSCGGRRRKPGCRFERRVAAPNDRNTDDIHERDQQQFGKR